MTQLQVRLYRDSFTTPWGFRLQGGRDIGPPLTIQRVFSNSPAEGELQRGDRILSIGGRPGSEVTHQQAQDIIRRPAGQIDVVVQRPAPSHVSTTATFTPAAQRPRAHSLQLSPVLPTMPGRSGGSGGLRLNTNPCFNPGFLTQYSPSSPHPPPPWTRQNFAPQKVSKLSQLGGGAPDFGVDYGSRYGTVPRRRHSSQARSYMPQSHYPGAYPPRDLSPYQLGGQNYDFGTDYCTLPRTRPRGISQPPRQQPVTMPVSHGGFTPKKVTLSRLGGGGPEFGSDFTRYRPSSSVTQPVHVHTGGRGPQYGSDMTMNRMQDSMDSLSLSPRTPDLGYQAPPFAGGSQYIPTGVRLDMEREQELRQQQMQQQQQQPQYHQQHYQSAPEPAQQQQYYFEPQQSYVPTGVRLDHQMGEVDEQGGIQPVWERRRTFMNAPAKPAPAPTGKNTAPKVLKPKSGSSGFSFGVDYSKPAPKTSTVTWRPQPVQRPVNAAPAHPEVFHPSPAPWSAQVQHQDEPDEPDAPPAWRTSLKTTGVKPWDMDVDYSSQQQQPPPARSVGPPPPTRPFHPTPVSAPPPPQQGGGGEDGPRVVHLQYNSPMGLYSKDNVKATFAGQTKAMAAGGAIAPGNVQVQNPDKPGDRDWTQSAVYRMIYEEEKRGRPGPQQQQQQQQQQQPYKPPPPPPAPKPQTQTFQQAFNPMDGDFGTSDF